MSATTEQTSEKQPSQLPEWEHEAAGNSRDGRQNISTRGSTKAAMSAKLDRMMPPHRKYLGMRRNVLLWVLLAIVLALLALIIGLAAGLSSSSGGQNLPLPSNTEDFVGDLTYYEAGLGACGEVSDQDDNIVSISHYVFDAAGSSTDTGGNSNANPLCGKMIRAARYDEQYGERRSVDLKVVDRCTGCEPDDIDTTLGAFEKLAEQDLGRVDVTWAWLEPVATGK
ncbi:uncharacterized protein LTR77_010846 [Saxophila tyrrhenica]|uniref:RlpA-like protein double-psi beta-barrel domain-containing protein n=1 Tax=Saxophila tyrrhenica TaxID=1690608 RepID=A0AAV9NXS6_9PEZI|nr:hypothetical protein LTR77_010846 [Saxophila tyrrhenica]